METTNESHPLYARLSTPSGPPPDSNSLIEDVRTFVDPDGDAYTAYWNLVRQDQVVGMSPRNMPQLYQPVLEDGQVSLQSLGSGVVARLGIIEPSDHTDAVPRSLDALVQALSVGSWSASGPVFIAHGNRNAVAQAAGLANNPALSQGDISRKHSYLEVAAMLRTGTTIMGTEEFLEAGANGYGITMPGGGDTARTDIHALVYDNSFGHITVRPVAEQTFRAISSGAAKLAGWLAVHHDASIEVCGPLTAMPKLTAPAKSDQTGPAQPHLITETATAMLPSSFRPYELNGFTDHLRAVGALAVVEMIHSKTLPTPPEVAFSLGAIRPDR